MGETALYSFHCICNSAFTYLTMSHNVTFTAALQVQLIIDQTLTTPEHYFFRSQQLNAPMN